MSQLQILKKLIETNDYLEIPSRGLSMFPIITQKNICVFEKFDLQNISKGDILLFGTKDGGITGHRFLRAIKHDRKIWLVCKGDTNLYPDEPVLENQVIGKLTMIKKKDRVIDVTRRTMKIYSYLICHFRLFSALLHVYVHKILKKRNGKANEESSAS